MVELERLRRDGTAQGMGSCPPKGAAAAQQQQPTRLAASSVLSARVRLPKWTRRPGVPPYPQQQSATPFPNRPFDQSTGVGPRTICDPRAHAAADYDPGPASGGTRSSEEGTARRRGAIRIVENAPSAGRQSRRSRRARSNGQRSTRWRFRPEDVARRRLRARRARISGSQWQRIAAGGGSESGYSDSTAGRRLGGGLDSREGGLRPSRAGRSSRSVRVMTPRAPARWT